MNILFNLVANNDDDDWISQFLSKANYEKCAVVFLNKSLADTSVVGKKYATDKFYYSNLIQVDYSEFSDYMDSAPPIDEQLLDKMAPYQSQIMWMMERCVSREYNVRWNVYCKHIRFWNYVLDKLKINIFITKTTPHEVYDYVIYILCKLKGIKYLSGFTPSYYNTFYFIDDIYNQLPGLKDEYQILKNFYANTTGESIELNPLLEEMYNFYVGQGDRTPYYMIDKTEKGGLGTLCIQRRFKRLLRTIAGDAFQIVFDLRFNIIKKRFYFSMKCLKSVCSTSIKRCNNLEELFYKTKVFKEIDVVLKLYRENISEVDYSRKYIYVALHMQPENTSSPLGGIFVDQLLMIKMLSYWIPEGWIIYVKEHPAQIKQSHYIECDSYRNFSFYKELISLKNVKLVDLKEDTYKLIEHAKAVATLTGTVGLEAITRGIPALIFGYSYLQYAPNVYHIKNNENCEQAIKEIQKEKTNNDYKKEMKIYFKCLEKYIVNTTVQLDALRAEDIPEAKNNLASYFYEQFQKMTERE